MFHIHTLTKGGAERAVVNLAKELSDSGNDVTIVTSIKCDSEYEVPTGVKRIILTTEDKLGNRFNRMFLLGLKLRKIVKTEKPDVVIAFISGSIVRAVVATVYTPTKVIASVRNDPKFEYRGKMGKLIIEYCFPVVDGFVFQTKQAQAYFDKKIQERSTIIFNSVNPAFYSVERKPVKHRVVTCGRLDPQKNHKLLIEAFMKVKEKVNDAELYIYGKGPEYCSLKSQIENSNLSDSCYLKGETEDVIGVMQEADVFVLSSNFEGMPNILIEAITAGVPSVSTDCPCGGPREIIEPGTNGTLVKVGDADEMANAIIELFLNQDTQKKYSKNARESSTRFNPTKIKDCWEQFINSVC